MAAATAVPTPAASAAATGLTAGHNSRRMVGVRVATVVRFDNEIGGTTANGDTGPLTGAENGGGADGI